MKPTRRARWCWCHSRSPTSRAEREGPPWSFHPKSSTTRTSSSAPITSQLPESLSKWEASLKAADMVEEKLPEKSIVKVGKLFTMHRELIARRFGTAKEHELQEILEKLRALFDHSTGMSEAGSESREAEGYLRTQEVNEAVLALLYLNAFEDHGQLRSWKTFDWDAMDRFYERGFIGDPKSKAKSVPLTAEWVWVCPVSTDSLPLSHRASSHSSFLLL